MPWPLFCRQLPAGSPHGHALCPAEPRAPDPPWSRSWGRRSGAREPAHRPPWAKSGEAPGAHPLDEEALLEHAAVLHVATCEPPRCAVPAPHAPPRSSSAAPARRKRRKRQGPARVPPSWPASRTWAPGRPGRKSDLVGIPDVPPPPPQVPRLVLKVQSLPPGVAPWRAFPPQLSPLGRAPHPGAPGRSVPLTFSVSAHLPPPPALTRCLPGTQCTAPE